MSKGLAQEFDDSKSLQGFMLPSQAFFLAERRWKKIQKWWWAG